MLVFGVSEEVIIDVSEKHAGCWCFREFDHDVAWMEVCMNKIVKKQHILYKSYVVIRTNENGSTYKKSIQAYGGDLFIEWATSIAEEAF